MLDIVLEVFRQLTRSSSLKRLLFQLVSTEGDFNFMNINHWKLNVKPERLCFWIPIWLKKTPWWYQFMNINVEKIMLQDQELFWEERARPASWWVTFYLIEICTPNQQPPNSSLFARNARQHKMYQSPLSLQIQPCQIYSLLYQSDINLQWRVNKKKLLHFPWKNGSKNVDFCPRLFWTGWNW